ncbi:MAG: hypothetical protein ACXVE4_10765 [Solirubrobacteraceae bacterium]
MPPAAATSVAESMLVGKCGMVTRLGSDGSVEQPILAGMVGLTEASRAESETRTRLVWALATPPPVLRTATATVTTAAAPARHR